MADYGERYTIEWTNRQTDACKVSISSKDDYAGYPIPLEGSTKPFTLSSQAQDSIIPYGIKATEAVIEFYTGGIITLEDFYNEDDAFWLVQFYYRNALYWTGYLQLDNSRGRVTDQNYVLQLNANDGLGRLESKYLLNADGTPIQNNWLLTTLFSYIFAFIPSLDTKAWLNIFENSTQDRSYFSGYLTFLPQTAFNTRYFTNDDGTTQSLYDILNSICLAFRMCMFQADGTWHLIRWGDIRIFNDGEMPGTLYQNGFGSYSEIFFPESITIGKSQPIFPINENQENSILRPFKFVKETFNYNQPPFITQYSLQIATDAIPFATSTIGDFRYDDYTLSTYFPVWNHIDGDGSYLEVVTDLTTNTESDRYIVQPGSHVQRGLQFNPIPVEENQVMDFSLQFRTPTDISDNYVFRIRFILLTTDGNYWFLTTIPAGGSSINVHWNFIGSDAGWDDFPGDAKGILGSTDTTEWTTWSLSGFVESGGILPLIPTDGMLLIDVQGNNDTNGAEPATTTWWNTINISIEENINFTAQITGQYHTNTQAAEIKNDLEYDTVLDDSPHNTITGTLFTSAVTPFGANIGDVYFTKTNLWHRQSIAEERKLGDLNTFTDLFNQFHIRTIIEGDFYGLHDVSLISLINLRWLPTKKFIIGIWSADFMECIWNATMYEIFYEGESEYENIDATLLLADADITVYASTGTLFAISFNDIITNTDFTPDGGFINFTYNGVSGSRNLEVNINGIWNSTASATLNLNVNGTPVGSFFVGTGGAFHFFTANIMSTVTLNTSDVISVTMNWVGSAIYSLTVQANSFLQVTEGDIVRIGQYAFNYIYQTN